MTAPRERPENRWLSPGVLFGAFGMVASIFAAWMSFDSRITRVEAGYETTTKQLEDIRGELREMNNKLFDQARHRPQAD